MKKIASTTSPVTRDSDRPQERDGTSSESAMEQHKRWLGTHNRSSKAPYDVTRVSTPAEEDQPERRDARAHSNNV